MRIGIDCRALYLPQIKGIGIYLQNLLPALAKLDASFEYVLFYDSRQEVVRRKPTLTNFSEKGLSIRKGDTLFFWEQLRLPCALKHERLDLFHSPANTTFSKGKIPLVVTVHDTIVQQIHHASRVKNFYFKKLQPFFLRRADRIIVPSFHSKNNLIQLLRIQSEKISVIPQGVNPNFRVLRDRRGSAAVKQKFGIKGQYILFAGGESPWKNVSRLIKTFHLLRQGKRIAEQLVITGIRSIPIFEKHQAEIQSYGLKLEEDVLVLGYINEEDLIGLYNAAEIFVYPSLNEGFGFPPLEAMACQTAVAASNAASIPEVVGDAALLFDGTDVNDMAEKIYTLLTNASLRQELKKKGLRRAQNFPWEKTAKETRRVYEEIA